MKYLSQYMEERQTKLFDETNSFFAFSMEQFNEQKKEGVTYVNLRHGMICDERHVKTLIEGLDTIYKESIALDLKENGKENVVKRELGNHECYYTSDISPCVDALKDYDISFEYIRQVYYNNLKNQ
jgi:poly-D-alanine transfer protein DltD